MTKSVEWAMPDKGEDGAATGGDGQNYFTPILDPDWNPARICTSF